MPRTQAKPRAPSFPPSLLSPGGVAVEEEEEEEEGGEEKACAADSTLICLRMETTACLWERMKSLATRTLSLEGWREARWERRAEASSGFRAGGREGGREGGV